MLRRQSGWGSMVIRVKNLRTSGILGVYDEERRAEREIVVNVRLEYDARAAAQSDSIEDALDYQRVQDRIEAVIKAGRFRLLETLADRLVKELTQDARIHKLRVEVDKPGALALAESVSVTAEWDRSG